MALLCALGQTGQAQDRADSSSIFDVLTRAYSALRVSPAEALPLFEQAVQRDSTNPVTRRQLGSIYVNLNRPADALREFATAQRLRPSDTTRLQIAYLQQALGRQQDARTTFESLRSSNDPGIVSQAESATLLFALMECSERNPWWWRVYAAPYYESRFKDLILSGAVTVGHTFDSLGRYSWFGSAGFSADTRSESGALPQIYQDNVFVLGGGLRARPLAGLSVDLQAGIGADLLKRPGKATVNPDFRAVASYGIGIYPPLMVAQHPVWPFAFFAETYVSAGDYSRYANVISYLQARAGVRALAYGQSAVDLYLRGDITADTHRDFFNNIAELSGGIRFIPHHRWGVQVLAEVHAGTYVGPTTGNPYDRRYDTFRLFVILDRTMCW